MTDVTVGLWKMELREKGRYVPDYPEAKASYYKIFHESNLKISMKASEVFNQMVKDLHDDYYKHQLRNHIPRVIGDYKMILNDPKMAAFSRCVPVDLYYRMTAIDSPGYRPAPTREQFREMSFVPRNNSAYSSSSAHSAYSAPSNHSSRAAQSSWYEDRTGSAQSSRHSSFASSISMALIERSKVTE
jgi:hypothetical protein